MAKFSISSEKVVLHADLFDVHEIDIVKESGEKAIWHNIKQMPVVFILALTKNKEVYLVKQFRFALNKETTEIPAGYMHDNEDPLDAAKRELREETGLTAKKWTKLGELLAGVTAVNGTYHYFLAEDFQQGEQDQDDTEDIHVICVPLDKAVEMATNGEINITNNIVGILLLKEFLAKKGLL